MVGADGGTFTFGNDVDLGSLPGLGVHVNNVVSAISIYRRARSTTARASPRPPP
jgi:hypothetical protein